MRYTFSDLQGAGRSNAVLRALSKPIRIVLAWQAAATVFIALTAALFAGTHGALSAAAGGAVGVASGFASALVAASSKANSPGGILIGALRAEAVKIGLALLLLWAVLTNYADAVIPVVLGAFVVTILIFSMAFFIRDH